MNDLKKLIREVPDYPKPGILFYDLTTLLKDKKGFHRLIDLLCEHYNGVLASSPCANPKSSPQKRPASPTPSNTVRIRSKSTKTPYGKVTTSSSATTFSPPAAPPPPP